MNRRSFLKIISGGVVAAVLPGCIRLPRKEMLMGSVGPEMTAREVVERRERHSRDWADAAGKRLSENIDRDVFAALTMRHF